MGLPKGSHKPPAHLRRKDPDPVFGERKALSNKVLPLTSEVGQALIFEAEEERFRKGSKEIDCGQATRVVTKQLVDIYKKASIPTLETPREGRKGGRGNILNKVKKLWELRRDEIKRRAVKPFKGVRRCKSKNKIVKKVWNDLKDSLFEIADGDEWVAELEIPFLTDQRGPRVMEIGDLDVEENAKVNEETAKKEEKKSRKIKQIEKERAWIESRNPKRKQVEENIGEEIEDNAEHDIDVNFRLTKKSKRQVKQAKLNEEAIVETADRFGVSNNCVAHIANEIRAAEWLISNADQEKVLYSSKVEIMRKRVRKRKVTEMMGKKISGLMFDERIDKTKIQVGEGEKHHKRFKVGKEEHCAVIGFGPELPEGSSFLGHLAPQLGTGRGLAQSLTRFLEERKVVLSSPPTFFSDGCSKMGGHKTGCHAELEELLGERAQRVFCMSHMIERPYVKLFEMHDGKTTGPESWSGEIGQVIVTDVWNLPVVNYEAFPNPTLLNLLESMAKEVLSQLKHDYIYLLEMGRALMTGSLSKRWADMKAGTCSTVRWTNPQSRTARLYMSTSVPSFQLKRMCGFLVYGYIPTLVSVKMQNTMPRGPHHFLQMVMAVEDYCLEEEKDLLRPILQFNGYQAHPECALLGMLASDQVEERKSGVELILNTRKKKIAKPRGRKKIRKFKTPPINFQTRNLEELVDLSINKLEPPLTAQLTEEEVRAFIETPFSSTMPCSTTEVERGVQAVTQSALVSGDLLIRDGFSFNKIDARSRNSLKDKKFWRLKSPGC